jgi:hypothetical protein
LGDDILSTVPGGHHLHMSGTSMATPQVARTASEILRLNPRLSTLEIKQIVLGTVDKKPELQAYVSTSGILNHQRALFAADLSLHMDLTQAISRSKMEVANVEYLQKDASLDTQDLHLSSRVRQHLSSPDQILKEEVQRIQDRLLGKISKHQFNQQDLKIKELLQLKEEIFHLFQ